MARPKLLFLSHVLPHPPDGGVKIRTHHLLRLLCEQFDVDALCFFRQSGRGDEDGVEQSVEALQEYANSVEAFPIPQEESAPRLGWDHLRSLVLRRPYTFFSYESVEYLDRLRALVSRKEYDVVHVDSLDLSRYLSEVGREPVVCDHHNVESELLRRRAASTSFIPSNLYFRMQARLLAREEERWCPEIELNLTVSERDRSAFEQRIPEGDFLVVPNGVDTDAFTPLDEHTMKGGDRVVFVGGCTWFPNRDALEFFATEILPILRGRRPEVRVKWVGRADDETRTRYSERHDIEMTGYVDDIRPHVHEAACYVVPIRVGGGTRLKILDAWAMGKAVVSTSQGCEGLEARDGENILIRDSADEFAEAVDRVLTDGTLRTQLGRAGRATAEQIYSWDVIGDQLNETYRGVVANKWPNSSE